MRCEIQLVGDPKILSSVTAPKAWTPLPDDYPYKIWWHTLKPHFKFPKINLTTSFLSPHLTHTEKTKMGNKNELFH